MTLVEMLNELARLGLRVREDGDELLLLGSASDLTTDLREALTAHKPELLALLRRRADGARSPSGLTPDPAHQHDPFPLTDIQQAYWIGRTDALGLGSVGCHYYQEFESSGLDLARFEEAFRALIRHHGMLRAVVGSDGRQSVLADVAPYRIATADLRRLSNPEIETVVRIRNELSHQVFAPDRWPLFDVRAALLEDGRTRVYLSFDLLMIDASSMSLLIRDWERLYRDPRSLRPTALTFRDCVLADIAYRESDSYHRALDYWDGRLDELPPPPELPVRSGTDTEPRAASLRRERRKGVLSRARWKRLKARGEQLGITPSALLAAAFGDVLGAWSRGTPFLLNLTLCRRRPVHPDVDLVLGDFTTTMLLDVDPRPETFRDRARRVHQRTSSDLDHADVSGVEVLRRLRRRKPDLPQPAAPVVFTSLLGWQGGGELFSSNWMGTLVYGVSQTPQVALDHQAFEDADALAFHWDFVPSAFAEGTVDAAFAAYQRLLETLADDDEAWSDPTLCLLPREQRERRAAVNDTGVAVSSALLHTLFEERARLLPQRPAVVTAGRRLSYGELDRESLALAYRLHRQGAAPNRLVAVVMEKGWEQVVAVLGILRSGAAYLPIDAQLPAARIRELLLQGEVAIAVTQRDVEDVIAWPPGITRLTVPDIVDEQPPGSSLPAVCPDDLAYVIFTSGSTGQPKGVMIDHRGAVNTILDINRRFRVDASDRILALSSLGFDLSVYDIFGVLAAGATIVVPEAASARDPQRWAEWMLDEGITVWNSVPALMRMLTAYAAGVGAQFPSLRLAMLSGDWIPVSLPRQIRAMAGGADVISLGGATEASIWSILHLANDPDPLAASVPYGKALANQSIHVLNARLDPSPDFVRGDIYIGGIGLARGYWRNPEETAARFSVHPRTGERLYKTGDVGRMWPDGNVELLGREDFQVKIQGHRIELGEIEHVLRLRPEIRDAVVTARSDCHGERQLVAYIVVAEGAEATSPAWQRFLSEQLPSYMIPAFFVRIDALPLTGNGKVDRSALPEPEAAPRSAMPRIAETNAERLVTTIVQSVLGRDGFDVQEPLFSYGCTSLHVVQIHRRLCEASGLTFSIAELFNRPTIALIAGLLTESGTARPAVRRSRATAGTRAEVAARRARAGTRTP